MSPSRAKLIPFEFLKQRYWIDGAPGKLGAFFVSRARVRAPGGPGNRNGGGPGNRDQGTGTGNRDQGSGNRDQGSTRRGMGQWEGCSVGCKSKKTVKNRGQK